MFESPLPFALALRGCCDYSHAQLMAYRLMNQPGLAQEERTLIAPKYLAVLLYSAAVMDEDFRRVHRWISRIEDKQTHAEVDSIVRWKNNSYALDTWHQFLKLDATVRSGIIRLIDARLQQAWDTGQVLGGANALIYAGEHVDLRDHSEVLDQALTAYSLMHTPNGRPLQRHHAQVLVYGTAGKFRQFNRETEVVEQLQILAERIGGIGDITPIKPSRVRPGPVLVIMNGQRRQCLADIASLQADGHEHPILLVDLTRHDAWDVLATHVLTRSGLEIAVVEHAAQWAEGWRIKSAWPEFMGTIPSPKASDEDQDVEQASDGDEGNTAATENEKPTVEETPEESTGDESVEPEATPEPEAETEPEKPFDVNEHLAPLDGLVGLEAVREHMREYAALVHVQKQRGAAVNQSMHMVLLGNPGTGKTTVARAIGKMLHATGLLPTDKFIEAQRSDLVGKYIGHTEAATRELIMRARGGVLFIDEAYSLNGHSSNDFGHEALAELVAAMENHRDDLVIIFAGYEKPTREMLELNPGLQSRLQHVWTFPDYSADDLDEIAGAMASERGYSFTPAAQMRLRETLALARQDSQDNFGNAREVRSQLERAIMVHAYRIVRDDLVKTEAINIIDECDIIYESARPAKKAIGFAA